MKAIQKHPLIGGFNSVALVYGSKFVGVVRDGGQLHLLSEGQPWGSAHVYWEVQIVCEGESFPDAMEYIGMADDPNALGGKVFVVGRING